jgi:hypothetical protein
VRGDAAGAGMRAIAEAIVQHDAAFVCLHGVDPGDALALATRFARGYAYRGGQALLWPTSFVAREVHDRYLPLSPRRPFDRRGLLQVDGAIDGMALTLVATQFSHARESLVRELRFARRVVRSLGGYALLVQSGMSPLVARIGVRDLGFLELADERGTAVYGRGVTARCTIL